MTGNDQVRFCRHCELDVQDLSKMTRAAAIRLVLRSRGRLCLRIHRNSAGDVITRPIGQKFHTISRRTSRIAAGAFTAVMSVSTAAYAQSASTGTPKERAQVTTTAARCADPGSQSCLTGTVSDPNDAVFPEMDVSITNEQTGQITTVASDESGTYWLQVDAGYTYRAEFKLPWFKTFTLEHVEAVAGQVVRKDVKLELDPSSFSQGAVDIVAANGQPLITASYEDDLERVTLLLRQGADPNQRDDGGMRALDLAALHGNIEVVRRLLSAGADVRATTENGSSVLFWLDFDSTPELVGLLVSAGAEVNHRDDAGNTPLIRAAEQDNAALIRSLLNAGAQLNDQNDDGDSALMAAAKYGSVRAVKALLAKGADHNLRNLLGQDALHLAVANRRVQASELLRAAGAVDQF